MNKRQIIFLVVALGLVGGTAGVLAQLRTNQKLGAPGVKTRPLPDSIRLQVELPEKVLDYQSEVKEPDKTELETLPADTSFGRRLYRAEDGFGILVGAVLMGADRTSLHKPQYCLTGQGWQIDPAASAETSIPMEKPVRYDLPVVKLVASRTDASSGKVQRGIYVYWFVADKALSASVSGFERMRRMAAHLLRTGELQRWAYVSCFAACWPGQEEAAYQRIRQFIAAAAPEFQLTPSAEALGSAQTATAH
jgi:hypothetical protein